MLDTGILPAAATPVVCPVSRWSYETAFARNLGLVSGEEQQRLRKSRVSIIGMGGVGGVHLVTLARLGIGGFSIADPDVFDTANFNRQYGATLRSLGRPKATVMAEEAHAINPELDLRVFSEAITADNVGDFLEGADLLVDGVDFFNIEARRLVFCEARKRGIWAVTAGPIGFSTAWLVFDPNGMSFDQYFDIHDEMPWVDQLIAFAVGLTPRATQISYMDLGRVNLTSGAGPSASLACQLSSGVTAAECLKILLGRGDVHPAPAYCQFDAYRHLFRKGRLLWGNRHPWQRFKRRWLRRRAESLGWVSR
jgi:molybdopterin/thiamine biosynthesis adenylyltransferase